MPPFLDCSVASATAERSSYPDNMDARLLLSSRQSADVGVRFFLFPLVSRASQGALNEREHLPTPCANSMPSGDSDNASLDSPHDIGDDLLIKSHSC